VLVADRFVCDARGRAFDLATAAPVRLVERTVPPGAARAQWRDRCQALLDIWRSDAVPLIDYAEVGQTRCIEVYPSRIDMPAGAAPGGGVDGVDLCHDMRGGDVSGGAAPEVGACDGGLRVGVDRGRLGRAASDIAVRNGRAHGDRARSAVPGRGGRGGAVPESALREGRERAGRIAGGGRVVAIRLQPQRASAGVCAALDEHRAGEVRRLYVRAPAGVGLTMWLGLMAREARMRGVVPVCPEAVVRWPEVARLVRGRSVIVLCDRQGRSASTSVSALELASALALALLALARAEALVCAIVSPFREAAGSTGRAPAALPALELSPLPVRVLARALVGAGEAAGELEAVAREAEGLPGRFIALLLGAEPVPLARTPAPGRRAHHQPPAMLRAAEASAPYEGRPWSSSIFPILPTLPPSHTLPPSPTLPTLPRSPRAMILADTWNLHARPGSAIRVAEALIARGRWAAAIRTLRADIAAHERRRAARLAAVSALALARVHLARCELTEANRWCTEAGELAARAEDETLAAEALHWSGLVALEDADLERSERWLRMALAVAEQQSHRALQQQVDLSLARCLFWQGRLGQMSAACDLAQDHEPARKKANEPGEQQDDQLDVRIRVQAYRLLARRHLARGDLSQAGDALTVAVRLVNELTAPRGDLSSDLADERQAAVQSEAASRPRQAFSSDASLDRAHEPRAAAPRDVTSSEIAQAGAAGQIQPQSVSEACRARRLADDAQRGHSALEHERQEWRCALDGDWARLQFAVGDREGCERHLRAALAARPSPARLARLRLLQLECGRLDRTEEARRRAERFGRLFLQRHTPRLLRLRARYWIEPAQRRASELVAFIDRYGEIALSGRVSPAGESVTASHFRALLQMSHENGDERTVLARLCAFVGQEVSASFVAAYGASAAGRPLLASAGSSRLASLACAERVLDTGLFVSPVPAPDAIEAGAPVKAHGTTIGAIICRWMIDAAIDRAIVSALLPAAADAAAPHVQAILDRAGADTGPATASTGTMAIATATTTSTTATTATAAAATPAMLGVSAQMTTLRETIARVADAPFHVLIEGESGSGKELVARALHLHSLRRLRRFCAVNCAALSDELLEAELFGHTRGAFTGALAERMGLFEEAHEGTLFLDEVGELSARAQAKLLRAIQDGEIRRIGENLPRRVHPRIVAATNRTLRTEAIAGRFREDLLYRLDVVRIAVPPLRDRVEDVPVLARAFWEQALVRTGSRATLDPETLAALARYDWPGNVRELQNVIARLAVQAPARGRVAPTSLPPPIRTSAKAQLLTAMPLDRARRAFEEQFVRAALARAGGHGGRAARELGVSRQGLSKLLARLGIAAPAATD
jgi:transcriptional regulator with GAF, ATPase, and Fis domain